MSDRITIISTCETRSNSHLKNYEPMAKRLVYSIRNNGGKYADSPILMYYSCEAKPSQETLDWLTGKGCKVVEGGPSSIPSDTVANKISACCSPIDSGFGLWMDSDMYVLDSTLFENLIDKEVDVAAVGSAYSFHKWATFYDNPVWEEFYRLVDVDPPTEKFLGGLDNLPQNFYFNSALVLFRNGRGFPDLWLEIAKKVRFSGIDGCELNFTQTSLTLTALRLGGVLEQLPQTYNAYYALEQENALNRAILHYQDNVIDFHPKVVWNV